MINFEKQFAFCDNGTSAIVKNEHDAMISSDEYGIWIDGYLNIPYNIMCKIIHNHDVERIRSELKIYLEKFET